MGILHPQFLVIKIGILGDRRATARRADDILECFSDGYVLASDLIVLATKNTVIGSFVLDLQPEPRANE